ncbi:hypothetical protein GFY24_01275 [Nocardia sp. SYP-A9097]|uniref:hypothetical protein n=1 Tax=Nocardia sp. SYP-A9097 TaxID=2663237 RepID=UPI00129A5E08|nr:hypothetical protein [Nocardia sp. SYP-A9097]MRH86106.1 hypothetical protein [Nocardia sp. SYP-A9097]
MLMRKFAATSALLIAAMGITAGTVNAAPATADENAPINYTATNTDTQTIIRTDSGSMVVEDGVFKVKAANGTTVAGSELKFRVDDFEFPIAANISDHTATLTPEFNSDKAVYKPVALPYENQAPWKNDYDREQAAWNRLKDTISMGATIGTLVGGIGGAAVGCLIGGATAGAVTGTLTLMFGALGGAAVGCIVGMSVVGFLGTLAGQIFITAPVAILAAVQYFTTINAAPIVPAPAK